MSIQCRGTSANLTVRSILRRSAGIQAFRNSTVLELFRWESSHGSPAELVDPLLPESLHVKFTLLKHFSFVRLWLPSVRESTGTLTPPLRSMELKLALVRMSDQFFATYR